MQKTCYLQQMQYLPADLGWKSFLPPASFKKHVCGEARKQKNPSKAPRGSKLILFMNCSLNYVPLMRIGMKSNWDLCSYKVSLSLYHLSESMKKESRKLIMERQWFGRVVPLESISQESLTFIFSLKLRGEPNNFLGSDPRSSEVITYDMQLIKALTELHQYPVTWEFDLKAFIFTISYQDSTEETIA